MRGMVSTHAFRCRLSNLMNNKKFAFLVVKVSRYLTRISVFNFMKGGKNKNCKNQNG